MQSSYGSYQNKYSSKCPWGFTLVEVLITLLVLSVGFFGMSMLLMRGTTLRGQGALQTQAQILSKSKIEQLSHVEFTLLATGSAPEEKLLWGAANQEIVSEVNLNSKGETNNGSNQGPFKFSRSFVVCLDNDNGGGSAASQAGQACGDLSLSRPDDLSCDVNDTTAGQAIAKVMTTFIDRDGTCHKSVMKQVLVNFTSA